MRNSVGYLVYSALPRRNVVFPFFIKLEGAEMCSYSIFLLETIVVTDTYICLLFMAAAGAKEKME